MKSMSGGKSGERTVGLSRVTPKMVRMRAEELAELKGRYACDVTESNLAQARRDLTDKPASKP